MANSKISALTSATTPLVGTETLPIVQGGATVKATVANITGGGGYAGSFTTLSATGVTTVQAGTALLPAITTSGDTNTGIWFPAADTIAFTEGGAESVRITSAGNVGIGTSSPSAYTNYTALTLNGTNGTEIDFKIGNTLAGYIESTPTLFKFSAESTRYFQWVGNGTERMRLNSSGTVILQGGSTSATGVGIAFPATQSASSDANTLDDYEEGTWTPAPDGTTTFTTAVGWYTKIGNVVHVGFEIVVSSTQANFFQIFGLPFSVNATYDYQTIGAIARTDCATNLTLVGTGTAGQLYNTSNVLQRYNTYNGKKFIGGFSYRV